MLLRSLAPSFLVCTLLAAVAPAGQDWPQFRGPNSSGIEASSAPLPAEIGPAKNVVWKTAVPAGHSSPVVVGQRIYLTAVDGEKLLTLALDARDGRELWRREAPHGALETVHRIGSRAQPTPSADGECVVSLFGSCGLFCYDAGGKLLWHLPLGPFKNDFGAGSSPILVGDRVILCQDHDTDSFLMALDKRTGKVLWKTDRSEFPRNFCTPVIWNVDGKRQIVVAATLRVVGYDFDSGRELWTVRGISRLVCITPVVGDGLLFSGGWAAGGDESERIAVEPFADALKRYDTSGNGLLEEAEVADGPFKSRYTQVDRDKSGTITREEYEYFQGLFEHGQNVVLAIKPGATGESTESHVAWTSTKNVPFCASPLFYRGRVYTVKDGGIFCSLDAASGKLIKRVRLSATGEYYSSPVAGDGKLYLANNRGQATVIAADDKCPILSTADFGEDCYATPALVGGRIYFRTTGHLYCFGIPSAAD